MACFDALKGFFHVPLDENSKLLTAMLTSIGVFIYNVLAMGLTNANDIFEQCLCDILHGLDGVFNIADDILVIGETYTEFKDNMIRFLDQCVKKYLHLNADKFKLDCDTVTFFGHLLTKDGMKPDPKKVKDIQQWPAPKDIKELQSFLGAVNYLARFIPHLSALRAPLQDLLKKENEFIWAQNHQLCFDDIKETVCKDITLKFYDPNLPIFIETDASQNGIGVVLLQPLDFNFTLNENNIPTKLMPVAFASKTLTSAECNYANIECELLGVVFGVLHFKHFTFGNEVNIITDHKPLVSLLKKSLAACSSRLSRLILKIVDYPLKVMYQPGRKMVISDALSCLSTNQIPDTKETAPGLNVTIHEVGVFSNTDNTSMQSIQKETQNDAELQTLLQFIMKGFPVTKDECHDATKPYFNYREELTVLDGLVLKGHHIVIPSKLRQSCLARLHIARMGVNKTLYQARQSVLWPGLAKDINEIILACPACMKYATKNCAEPLINDLATSKPWQALSIDNFEWKGHKYLIILDHFSHFVIVKSSDRIDTATTIKLLLEVFAKHGIPNKIRCHRGSNFTSIDFTNFCSDLGITLSFSSSYHHQSVPAERSVRTVKIIMKKCHETGTPWHLCVLEYLCTPLDDKTPSLSSLIGCQFKGLCPTFSSLKESQEGTLEHLIERCLCEKLYHDKKSRTLADIPTGSNAAVLDHRSNTWTVGNILDRSNRSYTVKLPNGKIIHCNRVDL